LIRGDGLFRLQRALGLIPAAGGLGVGRRAVLLAAVTWLPIAGWAAVTGRALRGVVAEPLLEHFGVHVRCLVAIPLLVLADATTHAMSTRLIPYFHTSGLVDEATRPAFERALADVARVRDRWMPWVIMVGLVLAWSVLRPVGADVHEVKWATDDGAPIAAGVGFGGWWFLNVARPIVSALILGWTWRLVVLGILFRRIAALDLSIVPTHPDGAGGLGFLDRVPMAFAPVVLAVSALTSSRWAHDVVYHDKAIQDLKGPAATLVAVLAIAVLAPLLAFRGRLALAKHEAMLEYGALVGEHGRRVRRRWILHETVEDPDSLLSAPELGPVADTVSLYEAVRGMSPIPIGKRALAAVILPATIPMIVVAALRVPVKDLVMGLVKIVL
jgi:hypothetical protein